MSLNQVTLIGHLGQDPEIRYTPSGTSVTSFRMATNERWTDRNGEKQERTEWHRIVCWGKTGEIAEKYVKKGDQVCIIGRISMRKWTDSGGIERYMTEIKADRLVLLGGGGKKTKEEGWSGREEPTSVPDDDIPF